MGVLKLFPGLPGVKIHDQLLTVLLGHIDDGVNVAYGAKYGFDAVPVPIRSSRAGRLFLDKSGNLRGRKVQSLLKHLENPSAGDHEQYFLIKPSDLNHLKSGIYRRYRIKNALSMAFSLPDQRPMQQTTIDFHKLIRDKAAERLPVLIKEKLARLL